VQRRRQHAERRRRRDAHTSADAVGVADHPAERDANA
jgi:hypothetical protein